ncbi:MAG: transcription antitermination factor NusB [bacterium]|nr:transcription antitermination factor NusB [candidate division WOR-3 bacterium]MDH5683506.1 transcription antitermination factor NusB [candidate division WOR-3 bacterium]
MTNRRRARECATQVFYRYDLVNESLDKTVPETIQKQNLNPESTEYFTRLVLNTVKHLSEIDNCIQRYLKGWTLERLATIDRTILRIACCELLFFPDIPPKVSINEAVDIAKKYSDDESGRFVNGVLDAVYKSKSIGK